MKKILILSICLVMAISAYGQANNNSNGLKNGEAAPMLKGVNPLTGQNVQLQQGKVNLVIFWATWCRFCAQELRTPEFAAVVDKYLKNPNFNFIAVSVDEKVEDIAPFVQKAEYSYIKDFIISDPERAQFLNYAPKSIPRTYVIGKDGKIFKSFLGAIDADAIEVLDEFIDTAINK
ncbi:MAG: TlpA family protein disulfide reductase [Bacteroidales bacterium]|nr:TlpA family protein disulfide reductase [Bacteroidales bacterium]